MYTCISCAYPSVYMSLCYACTPEGFNDLERCSTRCLIIDAFPKKEWFYALTEMHYVSVYHTYMLSEQMTLNSSRRLLNPPNESVLKFLIKSILMFPLSFPFHVQYKVSLYSLDGRCLASYSAYDLALGVKVIAWSPSSQFLAIGSYDQKASSGFLLQCTICLTLFCDPFLHDM